MGRLQSRKGYERQTKKIVCYAGKHMQHDVQLKPTFTTTCSVIIVIMSAISNGKSNSRNS